MEEKLELGRSSFAIRAIYVFPLWFYSFLTVNKVVYICSSFWLLAVVSRDLSPAKKETTACKADQIHEMATLFIQDNVECQLYITVILFSA